MTEITFISSPVGKIGVAAEGEFITKIFFKASELPEQWIRGDGNILLKEANAQLTAYFDGKLKDFDLPLYAEMSDFSKAVLEKTMDIPYGGFLTYGEIAERIGKPGGARAVGGALNKNPFPIVIPCHRVIASNGDLGGYALGIQMKKQLLLLEHAVLTAERENDACDM